MPISSSVQKRLDELNAQFKITNDEILEILDVFDQLPDLEITYDRWRNKRYSSLEVNAKATEYFTGYSCGCCDDAPMFLYPLIEINGIRVYTKPVRFYIGDRNEYTEDGVEYDLDCLEEMKTHGLTSELLLKAKKLVTRATLYLENSDDGDNEVEEYT